MAHEMVMAVTRDLEHFLRTNHREPPVSGATHGDHAERPTRPPATLPASDTATILRCAAIAELVARREGMLGGPAYTVEMELRQLARDLGV